MKKVLLLGATSHVAQALIFQNNLDRLWDLTLFARSPERVGWFLKTISAGAVNVHPMEDWESAREGADGVINCVGFGTPQKQRSAGIDLFLVGETIEQKVLSYLDRSPETKYINFSSGAVYGTDLDGAIERGFQAKMGLSPLNESEFYRISKIYQEAKHRALKHFSILDIRLFSFFSRFIDLSGGYLMTDIVNSLLSGKPVLTNETEIFRDYVSPSDLAQFISRVLEVEFLNDALDIYSAAPISKLELLQTLGQEFDLKVKIRPRTDGSPTGEKTYYYSLDRRAKQVLGYEPVRTSLEGIREELLALGLDSKAENSTNEAHENRSKFI